MEIMSLALILKWDFQSNIDIGIISGILHIAMITGNI